MRRRLLAASAAVALVALLPVSSRAADAPQYRLVPLGFLSDAGIPNSIAVAINERGQVTGYSNASPVRSNPPPVDRYEAFRWDAAGGMAPLGFLSPAPVYYDYRYSQGWGINERGQITGESLGPIGHEAAVWDPSAGLAGLGDLMASVHESVGYGINNRGTVVGSGLKDGRQRPIIWTPKGGLRDLGTPPGLQSGWAVGVNDSGQAAATAWPLGGFYSDFGSTAYRREPDGSLTVIPGLPGRSACRASAINAGGVVTGWCGDNATLGFDGFVWSPTEGTRPLGPPPGGPGVRSIPLGINDAGQVVGYLVSSYQPFLWDPDGTFHVLSDLLVNGEGWNLATRLAPGWMGINSVGQIVWAATNPDGYYEAVLLEPVTVGRLTLESRGAEDGWVLESGLASGRGGAASPAGATLRAGDDATGRQYRSILSFDTSAIPADARIFAATLRLRQQGLTGGSPFRTHGALKADLRASSFGAPALEKADFQAPADRPAAALFGALAHAGWRSASLDLAAFALLDRAGTTQFRLRFTRSQDGDGRADFLSFFSGDAPADRPTLTIEYTLPLPGAAATPAR